MRKMHTDFWWENPRIFGKTRHRRKDNINTVVKEIGYKNWNGFIWLKRPVVSSCKQRINLCVP
jgi:hypothetical protein